MNLVEGLARECVRVAIIRAHCEELRHLRLKDDPPPRIIIEPQIAMMTASIENGFKMIGGAEGIEGMMAAMQDLKEYSE